MSIPNSVSNHGEAAIVPPRGDIDREQSGAQQPALPSGLRILFNILVYFLGLPILLLLGLGYLYR